MSIPTEGSQHWIEDCMKWRKRILVGLYKHWCFGWDELPVDETCHEWPCECATELIAHYAGSGRVPLPSPPEPVFEDREETNA